LGRCLICGTGDALPVSVGVASWSQSGKTVAVEIGFTGEVFQWRGPAPYYYVAIPDEDSADIREASSLLTYGWGVIPVRVRVGDTEWETSLFPKDGRYLVPLKDAVRRAEGIGDGDLIVVDLTAGGRE
jgi:hypothetical protein